MSKLTHSTDAMDELPEPDERAWIYPPDEPLRGDGTAVFCPCGHSAREHSAGMCEHIDGAPASARWCPCKRSRSIVYELAIEGLRADLRHRGAR